MDATKVARDYATKIVARQAAGTNAAATPASASGLLSTLIPVLVVSVIFFTLFLLLRPRFLRYYSPRSYLSSLRPQEKTPALPRGLTNWFREFWGTSDTVVLNSQSLDGFLFLRLLKISVVICLVGCLITWPITFPINATGPGTQQQLNILTMGHATNSEVPSSYFRWFGTVACVYLFFGFILYMITRESIYFINLRQAYLISPLYANRVSSKTVLFTSVPDAYLNEDILREMLGSGVVRIWLPRNVKELEKAVGERDSIALKLEGAETKLIKTANANRLKALKENKDAENNGHVAAEESGSISARYVPDKKRPTHKLGTFGLYGKKVDSIDWCRAELKTKIPEVEKMQAAHLRGESAPLHSVFVEFINIREAQSAYQSLTHHQPLMMAPRFTGMFPDEIIWSNLDISWWSRVIRQFLVIGAVTAVVIFWTIPVAAIGAISNITSLTHTKGLTWLGFLNNLPPQLLGIVDGLLPVILLAVLMALLPIFLRYMAKVAGSATLSEVEYRVQNYYFAFQVVQVFLITSIASGIIASLSQILADPMSAPGLLAANLPSASTFFIDYFILQGLGIVSSVLVAITGLIVAWILGKFLDTTPRKQLKRWMQLVSPGLGTVYPIYTNLLVIAIAYSIIAPLVCGFAAIGLSLFYLAYRYQWLFVYGAKYDTKGLMYPRALQQLFVGLYIAEVCIAGIFGIGLGPSPKGAIGPFILMILFIIFTALYHISLNAALDPLINYLPKTLETEERRLLALEEQDAEAEMATTGGTKSDQVIENKQTEGQAAAGAHHAQQTKKPNMFTKWLRPDVYTDYHTLRKMVPRDFAQIDYDDETLMDAYTHPSVKSQTPLLWIPRDEMGISKQEVAESSKVIGITDEGAALDEKNNLTWDRHDSMNAPIYEAPIYY